jgi:hypothetical protein
MARKDLAEEVMLLCKGHFMHLVTKSKAVGITMWCGLQVWRLQAALGEQAEITKQQQQEFDRLQNVNI